MFAYWVDGLDDDPARLRISGDQSPIVIEADGSAELNCRREAERHRPSVAISNPRHVFSGIHPERAEAMEQPVVVVDSHLGEVRHRADRSCSWGFSGDVPNQPRRRREGPRVAGAAVVDELASEPEAPGTRQQLIF